MGNVQTNPAALLQLSFFGGIKMKVILIYWVIGCLIIGAAFGHSLKDCPLDKRPNVNDVLVSVAIWPAMLTALWVNGPVPPKECIK